MFGPLGLPELIFILVLALLIFGPKKLPEIGRTLGRGLGEFRRASEDLKRTFNAELALDDEEGRPAPRRPTLRPASGSAPRPAGPGQAAPEGRTPPPPGPSPPAERPSPSAEVAGEVPAPAEPAAPADAAAGSSREGVEESAPEKAG